MPAWPELSYAAFAPTAHLLHMSTQMMGKLALLRPFEPQWSNVALELRPYGLGTGRIDWAGRSFEVELDLVQHEISARTSDGRRTGFALAPASVAQTWQEFRAMLARLDLDPPIYPLPQEVAAPVRFELDASPCPYETELVQTWGEILRRSARLFERFRARFLGKAPPLGFMWGTFDLRIALYNGRPAAAPPGSDLIYRNAMNAELYEAGWWPGDARYPHAAFYAFAYPQAAGAETIVLDHGRWSPELSECLLDNAALVPLADPESAVSDFLERSYHHDTRLAHWDPALLGTGLPA